MQHATVDVWLSAGEELASHADARVDRDEWGMEWEGGVREVIKEAWICFDSKLLRSDVGCCCCTVNAHACSYSWPGD